MVNHCHKEILVNLMAGNKSNRKVSSDYSKLIDRTVPRKIFKFMHEKICYLFVCYISASLTFVLFTLITIIQHHFSIMFS